MNRSFTGDANILIASDITGDATLVKKPLDTEFDKVFVSADPDHAVPDFDHHRPDVLVLAFKGLEKSERHCLKLYPHGNTAFFHPHRTVVLCNQKEVPSLLETALSSAKPLRLLIVSVSELLMRTILARRRIMRSSLRWSAVGGV